MTTTYYFAWRTADDLTHVAWAEINETFSGRYTVCRPFLGRRTAEGQDIDDAVITCVYCVAGSWRGLRVG